MISSPHNPQGHSRPNSQEDLENTRILHSHIRTITYVKNMEPKWLSRRCVQARGADEKQACYNMQCHGVRRLSPLHRERSSAQAKPSPSPGLLSFQMDVLQHIFFHLFLVSSPKPVLSQPFLWVSSSICSITTSSSIYIFFFFWLIAQAVMNVVVDRKIISAVDPAWLLYTSSWSETWVRILTCLTQFSEIRVLESCRHGTQTFCAVRIWEKLMTQWCFLNIFFLKYGQVKSCIKPGKVNIPRSKL